MNPVIRGFHTVSGKPCEVSYKQPLVYKRGVTFRVTIGTGKQAKMATIFLPYETMIDGMKDALNWRHDNDQND